MKLKYIGLFTGLFALICILSCSSGSKKSIETFQEKGEDTTKNAAFSKVNGVRFYEVKRRFKNGLSFNAFGFQHEPTWIVEFKAPDTMLAYSPEKQGMESFYLQYDHGQVYNFAREFFRAKSITKDSLVLQRLQVDGIVIADDDDIRSDVYCTFYTKDYIENKLKTTIGELQKPTKADTLFIKQLSAKTYQNPASADLAFAARQPVVFLPNSKNVSVEKISTIDELNKRSAAVDYLYPLYRLQINKSYKDFNYSFSVIVDAKGKLHVNSVNGVMKEDVAPRKKLLQGITDVYLQNLFIIKPGRTLGIPHSSEVNLVLVGKTTP
jgi:hypothetical protein